MEKKTSTQNQTSSSAKNKETVNKNFDDALSALQNALMQLRTDIPRSPLTHSERRSLQGAGVRRYGLIDKTMDYAEEFSSFAPAAFSLTDLVASKHSIEALRDIQVVATEINRIVSDGLLIYGNEAWDQTLLFYTSVREQARRNVPGARELFERLNLLFRPRGREKKITEPEIERDVKALLHGKKDGKIVIENERPHLEGGKHIVVDETNKNKFNEELKID